MDLPSPQIILAADHRARGVITIERYADLLDALRAALPSCDGLMASAKPLADLARDGLAPGQSSWLSLNRTGLANTPFELDDRSVASAERAKRDGYTGVKWMTRIDRDDPISADALEMLGALLEDVAELGLDAMIEPLSWHHDALDRSVEGVVFAAIVAHDLGAPLLKVPVPDVQPGPARVEAVARVVASVGVPLLFLGGPYRADRQELLQEIADAMAGGAAGLAIGRGVYQDPYPGEMAALVRAVVDAGTITDDVATAAKELSTR
ncbi:MAG: deoxyribose-phosphate aldolase [Actinomycetia bacterium]|nr:deoxyribose-phosphate aldolase [Actinomycetes bacterium]